MSVKQLAEVKAVAPQLRTAILLDSVPVDPVKLPQPIGADYVHPCREHLAHPSQLLTPEWVAYVRQAELGIVCWHEERPSEIVALRCAGIDAICSNSPELLLCAKHSFSHPGKSTEIFAG